MNRITYIDSIYYKKYISENMQILKDNEAEYNIYDKKINHPHDKIIKTILDKKEEAVYIINKVLKLADKQTELKAEDIEKYNRKFITKSFENSEADIIYKIKNKNIFFLIEHQSKRDYSMPYRIMKYSIEIIESVIDNKKINKKDYIYPCVYPIVIYTGKKRWDIKTNFNQLQENLYETKEIEFTKYNLVDINLLSERELLEDKSFFSKILLIEKSKTEKELIHSLYKIIEKNLDKEESEFIRRLIYYILKERIPSKEIEKLLKILEEKEELNMRWMQMLGDAIDKRFEEGLQRGINEGRKLGVEQGIEEGIKQGMEQGMKQGRKQGIVEGILNIAKKMLEKNMEIKEIEEITGLSKEEIEKLVKNEM